jgi:hypothetical protein
MTERWVATLFSIYKNTGDNIIHHIPTVQSKHHIFKNTGDNIIHHIARGKKANIEPTINTGDNIFHHIPCIVPNIFDVRQKCDRSARPIAGYR